MNELSESFTAYRAVVTDSLDHAEEAIDIGDIERAADILSALTQVHARAAVSFRNVVTKAKGPRT